MTAEGNPPVTGEWQESERDPDDISVLRDDTRRANERLSAPIRAKRALRQDANKDEQAFRDQISLGQTVNDVSAEAAEEMQEIERLDVLEGLRALQTGDPITWRIYRVGHENADLNGFLANWTTSQLTQERLSDNFGGGTYRIRGTYSDGKFAGGRTIKIAGDAIRKDKNNVATASNFNPSEFLAQQEVRDAARRRDEEQRRDRERKEAEDKEDRRRKERNEMLALVLPAVTGLTTALVSAFTANRGPDLATLIAAMKGPDPVTMLTQLKALEKGSSGNDALVQKLFPMLLDRLDSPNGSDTGWLDVAKELAKSAGPVVGGMIEQAMTARAAPPAAGASPTVLAPSGTTLSPGQSPMTVPSSAMLPPVPLSNGLIVVPESIPRRDRRPRLVTDPSTVGSRVTPGTPSGPVATATNPLNTGANMFGMLGLLKHKDWLIGQVTGMLPAAQKGRDPQVYAALFLEETPEELDAKTLLELLSRSDWYAMLAGMVPDLQDERYQPWFTALREFLAQSLSREVSGATAQVVSLTPTPIPPRKVSTGEIERPTKLPSLTGD